MLHVQYTVQGMTTKFLHQFWDNNVNCYVCATVNNEINMVTIPKFKKNSLQITQYIELEKYEVKLLVDFNSSLCV